MVPEVMPQNRKFFFFFLSFALVYTVRPVRETNVVVFSRSEPEVTPGTGSDS